MDSSNTDIPGCSRRLKKSSAMYSQHETSTSIIHANGTKKTLHHSKSQRHRHRSSSSKPYDDSKAHKTKHQISTVASTDKTVSRYGVDLFAVDAVEMTMTKMNAEQLTVHPLVQQILKSKIEENEEKMRKHFDAKFKLFMEINSDRIPRTTRSLTKDNQSLKIGGQLAIENDASQEKRPKKSNPNNAPSTVTKAMYSNDVSSPSSTSAQSFHGFNLDSSFDETTTVNMNALKALYQVPKNTNRDLHFKHKNSGVCIVCRKHMKLMVSHLKTVHPNQEVFVSRFSPQMADVARNGGNRVETFTKNSIRYISAMCFFCEMTKDFMPQYWIMHQRSHTGEYAHHCNSCKKNVCFHQHCGIATECRDIIDLKTTDLMAYICRDCNFVQIREKNMHKHLANEHGFSDYRQRYDKIMLLPAWNRQPNRVQDVPGTSTMNYQTNFVHQPNIKNSLSGDDDPMEMQWPEDSAGFKAMNDDPFKLDPDEKSILKGVSDFYRQTNDHCIAVRPWIVGDETKKPSMSLITQFALFKCMHPNCIFSTDLEDKWTEHMIDHIKLMDVFQQNNWLTTRIRENQIKFRECPYCPVEFGSNCEVTSHIEEEHRRSILQCAYCFYRTIEMDNIVLHYAQFHDDKNAEILLTADWRAFEDRDNELLIEGIQYFREIECSNCDKQFTHFDSFYQHLNVVHSNEYICKYCNQAIKCSDMEVQLHLQSHGFAEYQCLHCKANYNDIAEMRVHMSIDHPSHFLIMASRRSTAPIIYIGGAYESSHLKLLLCSHLVALSSMLPNLSKIDQHKLQRDFWMTKQITQQYTAEIPQIDFKDNIFVMFDDYEIHRPDAHANESIATNNINQATDNDATVSNVIYKCLTKLAIDEIRRVEDSDYTKLMCDCSAGVNITDMNSLKPYLDHLDGHPPCFSSEYEKKMIVHRLKKHAKSILAYIQVDRKNHVQKLIRCTFQCNVGDCNVECEIKAEMLDHYNRYHQDCQFNSRIKPYTLVIDSNDPKQMFASRAIDDERFQFGQLFHCGIHDQIVRTRAEVLLHNQQKHSAKNVEFGIKTLVLGTNEYCASLECIALENTNQYRMYLLKCVKCGNCFDSPDSVSHHHVEARHTGDVQFIAHKLIACSFCHVIGTYQELAHHHAAKHSNQGFHPVSALNRTICGLCDHVFSRNGDLSTHYRLSHSNGENYPNAFLERLQLNENDFVFEPACCPATKYNELLGLAQHLATCNRYFDCTKCTETFPNLQKMVNHQTLVHKKNAEDIINDIQNIKELLTSFSTSRIHNPNGLVIVMQSIESSELGSKLKANFIQHIQNDIWPTETRHIQSFSSRIEESTHSQKIYTKYVGKK